MGVFVRALVIALAVIAVCGYGTAIGLWCGMPWAFLFVGVVATVALAMVAMSYRGKGDDTP